jgi:cytidyltransferase-like protein
MNLLEANKPKIQGEIVVYAGRFQPFHKGHYDAYQRLVNEFGSGNVYIATSNDTSSDKSPFSFNEKKEIATKMFGVPSSKFVKVTNPYRPAEILKKYHISETTFKTNIDWYKMQPEMLDSVYQNILSEIAILQSKENK